MKSLILFLFVFFIPFALAEIVGETRIIGRVLKYDQKTVTVYQYGKRRLTVPRRNIQSIHKKLITGQLVEVVFSANEVMDKIQEQVKKQEQSKQEKAKKSKTNKNSKI